MDYVWAPSAWKALEFSFARTCVGRPCFSIMTNSVQKCEVKQCQVKHYEQEKQPELHSGDDNRFGVRKAIL